MGGQLVSITDKEIEYVEERLHSPAMHCHQCNLTRRLIATFIHLASLQESGEIVECGENHCTETPRECGNCKYHCGCNS